MSSTEALRIPARDTEGPPNRDSTALRIRLQPRYAWYPPVKTAIEYCVAVVLLVMALPILLIAAVLIKATSRGPVFYRQTRQGKDGRPYEIIKLRTMAQDAEAGTGAIWCRKGDPRITQVGRFLRATHLDEVPQLINVLKREMALIGPRPERPEIAETLEWHIAEYPRRLQVRPGITGLAQLRLPPDSDIEGVRKKVIHDLYYIHCMSPWLDCRICLKTGWLLFKSSMKSVFLFARLPDSDRVQAHVSSQISCGSSLVAELPDSGPAPDLSSRPT